MGPVRHDKGPRIWWDSYGVQQGLGRVTPVVGLGKGSEEEWDPCGAQGGAGGTGGPVCGAQGGVGRVDSVWGTVRIERVLSQQQDLQGGEFTGDKTGPEPPSGQTLGQWKGQEAAGAGDTVSPSQALSLVSLCQQELWWETCCECHPEGPCHPLCWQDQGDPGVSLAAEGDGVDVAL